MHLHCRLHWCSSATFRCHLSRCTARVNLPPAVLPGPCWHCGWGQSQGGPALKRASVAKLNLTLLNLAFTKWPTNILTTSPWRQSVEHNNQWLNEHRWIQRKWYWNTNSSGLRIMEFKIIIIFYKAHLLLSPFGGVGGVQCFGMIKVPRCPTVFISNHSAMKSTFGTLNVNILIWRKVGRFGSL